MNDRRLRVENIFIDFVVPENEFSVFQNESSVFNRLGESDPSSVAPVDRTAALTIRTAKGSRIVSDNSTEKPAKSHSVLPPLKPIRAVQPVKPVSTVKARVSSDTTKESNRKSVFSRLGGQTWLTRIFQALKPVEPVWKRCAVDHSEKYGGCEFCQVSLRASKHDWKRCQENI